MNYSESKIEDFIKGKLSEQEKEALKKNIAENEFLEQRVSERLMEHLVLKELDRKHLKRKLKEWSVQKETKVIRMRKVLGIAASLMLLATFGFLIVPYLNEGSTIGIKSIEQSIDNQSILGSWHHIAENSTKKMDVTMQLKTDKTFTLAIIAVYNNDSQKEYQIIGGGSWEFDENKILFENLNIESLFPEIDTNIQPVLIDIQMDLAGLGINNSLTVISTLNSNTLVFNHNDKLINWRKKSEEKIIQ